MAPKKEEKEAKLNPEQSAALILDYLRKQNRPYSATDISANLKNRVTKAATAKLLKDMHERQEIEGRAAGKQIVYHVIQPEAEENAIEALQEMDAEISRLRDATVALKSEEKELRASLREGTAQVPLPELKAAVASMQGEKAAMIARLEKLKSGSLKPVSAEERDKLDKEWKKWKGIVERRRKIRVQMWDHIKGETEKKDIPDLKEELDLHI